MVKLYLECRKTNSYPSPGGPAQQTAFAMELFEYLDHMMEDQREKNRRVKESPKTQKMKKAGT